MIRALVLYPSTATRFDFDYYLTKHTPLLEQLWKPLGLVSVSISRGVSGLLPGTQPSYTVATVLTFESPEALSKAVSNGGAQILADIPNFTDVQPDVQVCDVLL
ncbi:MAG: EthD family reductase [Acidobacteria bacterium]|nr:EthD family reductase [Acidobacteriota bacterium]